MAGAVDARVVGLVGITIVLGACDLGRPNGEPCLKSRDCESDYCLDGTCRAAPVTHPVGPTTTTTASTASSGVGGMGGNGGAGGSSGGMGGAVGGAGGSGGTGGA